MVMGRKRAETAVRRRDKAPAKLRQPKPTTSPPIPQVTTRRFSRFTTRAADGFSVQELLQAGLVVREARRLGLYVDLRRNTIQTENVQRLRAWLEQAEVRDATA